MQLPLLSGLLAVGFVPSPTAAASSIPGQSSFVAPEGFPTTAFSSYYFLPASPTQEPQPIISDPVLHTVYPFELTDPTNFPTVNSDPVAYPPARKTLSRARAEDLIRETIANVTEVIKSNSSLSSCQRCQAALAAAQPAAWYAPSFVPGAMVSLCESFHFASNSSCQSSYNATNFGAIWTQVLYYANVTGLDGEYICHAINSSYCSRPSTSPLNTENLFPKPKPANATARVPKASGERVKVLHMSDLHLDARYSVGAEANCSSSLCCRANNPNTASRDQVLLSASPYGEFKCDSPYDLALAVLQAVGPLTGTGKGKGQESLGWTLYTGDLVSHDPEPELSQAYVEYTETSVFEMFKSYLTGPVFAALGNHDTSPANMDAPHKLGGTVGAELSWNYDHVAGLWQHEGWIDAETARTAATHYGAYSIKNHYGLRIITLNTDFWYSSNYLNFIDAENPDNSGILAFLIQELQKAEDAGERVWIMGHVLSGWDGTNPIPNPTNLFYQIVDRYSPHVIANIFFGHTHEDQFMIYFANNGTVQSADTALTTGWIGPSVTPLTNLNSGFRLYEVDTGDFNIYEAYTFVSNVSSFASLNGTGPTYSLEYSTRETYGPAVSWGADEPLNATFWFQVTEAMARNISLVTLQNTYQGKSSTQSPNCTNPACQEARICYMRSGSVALGSQCPQGYGSVQSAFT
ncbi:hypothetical protein DTO169E5_2752 [Paecilomyces variotii]|nr:hypothetical protein DTO169C6_2921 [Paecilomyces variotii]KAJ9243509.1 hypothetical protein DTO169E5_2752 [Paecilomyces variotii]KAJ9384167.1 hypothetical protein DTO063F5_4900 [Paecilomyces variotii]